MQEYRKKPVKVQAVQYDPEDADMPRILGEIRAMGADIGAYSTSIGDEPFLIIKTLEGNMTVEPGDWIIRGVAGEFYPCKDAIFQQTYEVVY